MPLTIILIALVVALAYGVWRFSNDVTRLKAKYATIIDIDSAVAVAREELEHARQEQKTSAQEHQRTLDAQAQLATAELDRIHRDQEAFVAQAQQIRTVLNEEYQQALVKYKALKRDLALVEESVEDISFGLYKSHFDFKTPDDYKGALNNLRERERALIHEGRAAICPVAWQVGGSQKEGERMVKQTTRLVLRAFNGECDAARADVSWNNITKMEERINKSVEDINKLSGVLQVTIATDYLKLKLDELRLTHECEEKKHQEREEQRRIREQIREEERAQREFEKAQQEAEEEEVRYQRALSKAREEAAKATGTALEKLTKQISGFEEKLDEARRKKERAISRAQLTKSGFVYVISNIGSFGERVVKIGMTRRLEPTERVDELGGASVPFPFDLHAMLYSDNAPELEYSLHQLLTDRRLNLVNSRREFYQDIDLAEIEDFVKSKGLSAQFIKVPEAREYRETLARREQERSRIPQPDTYSPALFEVETSAR